MRMRKFAWDTSGQEQQKKSPATPTEAKRKPEVRPFLREERKPIPSEPAEPNQKPTGECAQEVSRRQRHGPLDGEGQHRNLSNTCYIYIDTKARIYRGQSASCRSKLDFHICMFKLTAYDD